MKLRRSSLWSFSYCCGHLFLSVSLTLGMDNPPSLYSGKDLDIAGCLAIEFSLIGPQKVKIPYPDWQSNNMGFVMTMVILLSHSKGPHINYTGNRERTASSLTSPRSSLSLPLFCLPLSTSVQIKKKKNKSSLTSCHCPFYTLQVLFQRRSLP